MLVALMRTLYTRILSAGTVSVLRWLRTTNPGWFTYPY